MLVAFITATMFIAVETLVSVPHGDNLDEGSSERDSI
jgi:hypothetical protein